MAQWPAVNAIDGRVAFDSTPDAGTTVSFWIPGGETGLN